MRLGEQAQSLGAESQALRTQGHLAQRLLACDIERLLVGIPRQGHQRLEQKRGFADPRIAADQHHRPRHQPAPERAIELADAERPMTFGLGDHLVGIDNARRRLGHAEQSDASAGRRRRALQQRVPCAALGALAAPLGRLSPAGLTLEETFFPHLY